MNTLKLILGDQFGPLRATAVIVLYQMTPNQSPAFISLLAARTAFAPREAELPIVLCDNSPIAQQVIDLPASVIYHHDPSNPGVAGAYNRAAEIAACNGSQWLITLDQDTRVPEDYLIRMAAAAQRSIGYAGVGAVVPQIAAGRKLLSPHHLAFGALPRWFPSGFQGIPSEPVFAFNSGAMIRIDALEQIGGYDTQFSLEYSDTAMFRKLHQYGKRVGISGDIQLRHEFSLIEMNRLLSAERYRRTLAAESAFWDLHMNWLAGCERTMRLLLRSVRQRLRKDRADLRRVTLEFLALRLFHSRRFRLARWRAAVAGEASHIATMEQRPRVSVCMAAYNGGRFIQEQLDSIFPQLAADDEVVIVDDCSTDDTIARIQNCRDERIRLLVHEKNQGVVATFEDTLRSAHGDILFLCDDDDLWAPGKVERVLREFEAHPDVHIVTTRAVLIDDRGARLPNARVNRYGEFLSGFWRNILMNHYQGSAMAIRASLLGRVLPFPRHKLFLHDVWIGTRNDAAGGKTSFIDEPLLYYRRHAKNSSLVHRPLRKVRVRLELLWAHLSRTASISSD